MAERKAPPASAANIGWNTTPTNPSTDPSPAVRAAGWALNQIPGSDEFNYLQTMWGAFMVWLRSFIVREWDDLYEGIDESEELDIFRVMPAAGNIPLRGAQVFEVTGTGGATTNVFDPCTDGEQIYYLGGVGAPGLGDEIVAASPADGSEIWEYGPSVGINSICTDGLYIYMSTVAVGSPGLYAVDRDGAGVSHGAGAEYYCTALAANGYYCAGVDPTGKAGYVVIYSNIQSSGSIAEDGTYDTTSAALGHVAIDDTQCYVGGTRSAAGDDVWAVTLSDHTLAWQITISTTGTAPAITGIAADGDRVYVVSQEVAISGGVGAANLWCLDRFTGEELWSMNVRPDGSPASSCDLESVAVDHRYIYVTDDNDDLHVIAKTGGRAQVAKVTNFGAVCCDGVSAIGNSELTTELKRSWMLDGEATFQMVPPEDVSRRPFHHLAVPINKG